jgi:hypothetical protein
LGEEEKKEEGNRIEGSFSGLEELWKYCKKIEIEVEDWEFLI